MSYGYWERAKDREARAFYEKAFRRKGLAEWDARWHRLSPEVRRAFLDEVKGPVRSQGPGIGVQPSVGVE